MTLAPPSMRICTVVGSFSSHRSDSAMQVSNPFRIVSASLDSSAEISGSGDSSGTLRVWISIAMGGSSTRTRYRFFGTGKIACPARGQCGRITAARNDDGRRSATARTNEELLHRSFSMFFRRTFLGRGHAAHQSPCQQRGDAGFARSGTERCPRKSAAGLRQGNVSPGKPPSRSPALWGNAPRASADTLVLASCDPAGASPTAAHRLGTSRRGRGHSLGEA
jgi:hypothetical protein